MTTTITPNPSTCFSVHSLPEESDTVSEVQEIREVSKLQNLGDKALVTHRLPDALKLYNDAVEIDGDNIDSLCGRASVFIQMGNFILAQHDADRVISLDPSDYRGHYMQALALGNLGYHREALVAMLKALDLDLNLAHADMLTDSIAHMAHEYCPMPDQLIHNLEALDPAKKLSEVGACLYNGKKFDVSIKVLAAAQRLVPVQPNVLMKIQLTQANAQSALKQNELAVEMYKECLLSTLKLKETKYQIKVLVSLASLHLEMNNTHQAILYYEKLLNLKHQLLEEEGNTGEHWTETLECALHLNLSIAYKSIGAYTQAVKHAEHYLETIKNHPGESALGRAHHTIGLLYDVLGKHEKALEHIKQFQAQSKAEGNQRGLALAYGCMGSIYSSLRNAELAKTFHKQALHLAEKLKEEKLVMSTREQYADSLMLLQRYDDAIDVLTETQKQVSCNDLHTATSTLSKLGLCFKAQGRLQYSLYYFEKAKQQAEDYGLQSVLSVCEFNIACIHEHSSQIFELDQAEKFFKKLIPLFEEKIIEHWEEDTFCPATLTENIHSCYNGIFNILMKQAKKAECLLYAEAYKSKHVGHSEHWKAADPDEKLWNMDQVTSLVTEQDVTVLYFVVLQRHVLFWVLQPNVGIAQFFGHKCSDEKKTMGEELKSIINEIKPTRSGQNALFEIENRSIPQKGTHLQQLQKKNHSLSTTFRREQLCARFIPKVDDIEDEKRKVQSARTPQRRLFDMLMATVNEALLKLPEGSPVIIIPDKDLFVCPFASLEDWAGKTLDCRYRITLLPHLHALQKIAENKSELLKRADELDYNRMQPRIGGMPKLLIATDNALATPQKKHSGTVNFKKISNPRLVTSTATTAQQSSSQKSKSSAFFPSLEQLKKSGIKTTLDHMSGLDSMSTLTAITSTGTEIVKSDLIVPEYKQVSSPNRCVVIGCPLLPASIPLYEEVWKPNGELSMAQWECTAVAEYMEVEPILAERATKNHFLKEIAEADVLHIATRACVSRGCLVFTPNKDDGHELSEDSFLVDATDILRSGCKARLVVLSAGWSLVPRDLSEGFCLPNVFLAAGAQCVLTLLWALPCKAMDKFYFHFYKELNDGCLVSAALKAATAELKADDRYKEAAYTSSFVLIGRDVHIDLKEIRHAMLDQAIDQAEKVVTNGMWKDPLNPSPITPANAAREQLLSDVQGCLAQLIGNHHQAPEVLPRLIILMDEALHRLQANSKQQITTCLPEYISKDNASMTLLKLLGFHFQAKGAYLVDPYVLFPHWNPDEALQPVFSSLTALLVLLEDASCYHSLQQTLPASQEAISFIVDVCSLTFHAPEIQLKVNDLSVQSLWRDNRIRTFLINLGFHQIGPLLSFRNHPSNLRLLLAALQIFISFSSHKSPVLLHKLDISLLGAPHQEKSISNPDLPRLPTLTPMLLPRNQLRMSAPWLSVVEVPSEMQEKIKLAKTKSDVSSEFKHHMFKAQSWHADSLAPQGNDALQKQFATKVPSKKVKVVSGGSASLPRIPVDQEDDLDIQALDQRRDYAQFILTQRLDEVATRHRNDLRKLYLPYVENA